MGTSVVRELLRDGPLLTDGAWGTELQARGLGLGECADAWNLSHPEQVRAVGKSYVDAGSRVILTNTFRANSIALAEQGLGAQMAEINAAGVQLSRESCEGRDVHVIASIGPSGTMCAPGAAVSDKLRRCFAEQCEALAEARPDALLLETMVDLTEAQIALRAARETGLPVIVSFAFFAGENRDQAMTGATPEQVVAAMEAGGADGVGANCVNGMELLAEICARMRAATKLPLWMKANAGIPEIVAGKTVYQMQPDEFASHLPALVEAGADFVGGCCGSTPAYIRALRMRWEAYTAARLGEGSPRSQP